MQRRAPIIDEISDITFEFMKTITKGALVGLYHLGAGVVFACYIPFARDTNEHNQLVEMSKASLLNGGIATAYWAVPTALVSTLGVVPTLYAAGLTYGVIKGGMSFVKAVREISSDNTIVENTSSSTEQLLREIGYRQPILTTPVAITPTRDSLTQQQDRKPQPEDEREESQFKLEM